MKMWPISTRNEAFKLHLKEYRERKEVARASAAQLPPTPATKEPAPSAQFDALALTYQSFAELSLSEFQALTSQELEELFVDCKVSTIHKAKFRNLHKILDSGPRCVFFLFAIFCFCFITIIIVVGSFIL